MGNTEIKINPLVITYKAGIYLAPGRAERYLSLIKEEIKRCFSRVSGKYPMCFIDYCLMDYCCHNHTLSFVNSGKGEIFIYPH